MTTTEQRPLANITASHDDVVVAAELVIAAGYVSHSMIQRKMRAGADKAHSILDRLAEAGVIARSGPGDPVVLVEPEDLDATVARLRATPLLPAGATPPPPAPSPARTPTLRPPAVDLAKREGGALATPSPATVALPPPTVARPKRTPQLLVARHRAVQVVTTLGGSGTAARGGRAFLVAARGVWVVGQGGISWVHRGANAATHGHLREQVRQARLAGDQKGLKEWVEVLNAARNDRIDRVLQIPKALLSVLLAVAVVGGVALAVGLLIGVVAFFASGAPGWVAWWAGVGAVGAGVAGVLGWLWWAGWWAAGPVAIVLAYREGKRASDPPLWLLAPAERAQAGAEITVDSISAALGNLKITALTKALKEGARLEFIVPPRAQGGGTYFQVRLPMGSMAADVLPTAKVELFAANCSRHKHEVWPQRQPDEDARVLDCWIADKGTMDQPAPPWPLLDDGTFNVFRDRVPWGVTMRGEPITIGMLQKHWLIGASSKQGKSTALRSLLLALAFDVCVEFRLADLKGDGDFRMFQPMCHTYIEGQAVEHGEASVVMLEDLVVEMQRRYDEKQRQGVVGPITEQLARRRGSGFHPIFAVVDECQVMYMLGKAEDGSLLGGSKDESRAQAAAKRLHDQARAVNIQLIQSTQRPDPQTVPVRVREGVHVRASLYVPNINAAKMILADAAERGARPYDLRPGRDAGTVVVAGEVEDIPSGQAFAIVRTHYVSTEQAWQVAKRAIELRRKAGREAETVVVAGAEPIDHLSDIHDAMQAEDRVRTVVLLGRLIEMNRAVYEPWGSDDLAKALREYEHLGLDIRKSDGQSVVRLGEVVRALQERQ